MSDYEVSDDYPTSSHVLARHVLGKQVLGKQVLGNPVLCKLVLGDQLRGNPVLGEAVRGNQRGRTGANPRLTNEDIPISQHLPQVVVKLRLESGRSAGQAVWPEPRTAAVDR
ncbi:MAG: hypothetical protein JSU95_17085 [Betaproteobacteria bacterium]|nr:MAG: hypothetical protein JSU95_17085 [Betaproteobacteria bacterium]